MNSNKIRQIEILLKTKKAQAATVSESLSEFAKFVAAIIIFALVMGAFFQMLLTMHRVKLMMDARIVANAIAGVISAVSAAPEMASYCYTFPPGNEYKVAIGGGYVFVSQNNDESFGISSYPVPAVEKTSFIVGRDSPRIIVVRKYRVGALERIVVKAPEDFPIVKCSEVGPID